MAAITETAIRKLAEFKGRDAPVTSCYLNVDGSRLPRRADCEQQLDRLVRRANGHAGSPSVADDLDRITAFVRRGFDRSTTRGLAFFSCSAHEFWEVVELPVPVRDQLVVNNLPAVRQLERVVHEFDSFGVLLADRQRARMFVFELGELVERSELFDELPRNYDSRGEKERGDRTPHVEELARQHVRHAAAVAWAVFGDQPFNHLTIGASDEIAHRIERELHPYLRDRLCQGIPVDVSAPIDTIRAAALRLESQVEREREQHLVEQLRTAVGTGNRGSVGIDAALEAVSGRRVDTLLVSQGYSEPGWRCRRCDLLATVGRNCAICDDPMDPVEDVVEEAVEEALAQSCHVEICVENADLDVLGRIGALLRY